MFTILEEAKNFKNTNQLGDVGLLIVFGIKQEPQTGIMIKLFYHFKQNKLDLWYLSVKQVRLRVGYKTLYRIRKKHYPITAHDKACILLVRI